MREKAPPTAVAFDLDGTLLDSFDAIYEATVLALRDVAGEERARAWRFEDARAHEGRAFEEIARIAAGSDLGPAVAKRYRERFPEVASRVVRPFEDVAPALEALARDGVPLAVATNKPAPAALELLTRFGLARPFRAVLGAGDRYPPKPHPGVVVDVARALGVPPRELAFVGDAGVDVAAARAAGAHAWVIVREGARAPEGADRVLRSLEELPALMRARAPSGDP
ncbi:HAD family hydrolase [bacterium]|nr:HAD family hydrolase [bacterium]